MPSIFIWKASSANTSKSNIKIYSGLNWNLEENNTSNMSYKIDEQSAVNINNITVLARNIINMPDNWIGNQLTEVLELPYSLIKSDKYAKLEQIGEWYKYTLNTSIELTETKIIKEYNKISSWYN